MQGGHRVVAREGGEAGAAYYGDVDWAWERGNGVRNWVGVKKAKEGGRAGRGFLRSKVVGSEGMSTVMVGGCWKEKMLE